jgi:capsular polysaccharide biosynthesis protein
LSIEDKVPEEQLNSPSPVRPAVDRRRFAQSRDEEMESLLEYWHVLKRRRYLFAVPFIAVILLVFFYALGISAVYRSEAVILIEDPDIPRDLVGATFTNYASQQIQLVSRRLFTMKNITAISDRFSIYRQGDSDVSLPEHEIVRKFRGDMELNLVSEEMLDARGQAVEAAVAFTLALSENQRSGTSRTMDVSELLTASLSEAEEQLFAAETKLAEFKANNEGALPELYQLNLTVINRSEEQLSANDRRLQELRQRKLQLSSELASLSPSAPVTLPTGETIMSDRDRLRALLIDYRRKSAIYETGHPDLLRLEQEIETLQGLVGEAQSYSLIREQLQQERDKLASMRDRYSEDHPDIKNAESAIVQLESQLAGIDPSSVSEGVIADNPAYILINTQLQSTDLEIQSLFDQRRELLATISEHETLIRQAPQVEMQYEMLLRDANNARTKYNDLQAKLRAADVAMDVEQEITGQRFTVIEPPAFPVLPEPRNRILIMLLGLVVAGGVAGALVVAAELMDTTIRSAKELRKIVGAPPLVVIPYLDNTADVARSRSQLYYLLAAFFAVTALLILYVVYGM